MRSTQKIPRLSGFCNPANPPASHTLCRMEGCTCTHHTDLGQTQRHSAVVALLAQLHAGVESGVSLAFEVAQHHRPTHPTSEPDRWYCGELWCHSTWPCRPFLLAEEIANSRPGEVSR